MGAATVGCSRLLTIREPGFFGMAFCVCSGAGGVRLHFPALSSVFSV